MLENRSDCPISCSLDILGDRWTLLIIRDIMLRNKFSFSDFLESEERIATNILTDRLKLLKEEGILVKTVSTSNKSKFVYSLTAKGIGLLPIIIEMMDWGAKNNAICPRRELGKKIQKDKAGVVKEYTQKLKSQFKL